MEKSDKVNALVKKVKNRTKQFIRKGKTEKALGSISIVARILYLYNQYYLDEDLENGLSDIARQMRQAYETELSKFDKNNKRVLFYDGFGLDTRGYAKNYLLALSKLGYEVVYVTSQAAAGSLHSTELLMKNRPMKWCFIDMKSSYVKWMNQLIKIVLEEAPEAMFYYTIPNDVSGAVAFSVFSSKTNRFFIDLTDHAFWLGRDCCDYFFNGRDLGASNQYYERKIAKDRALKIGVNLIIPHADNHKALPFDVETCKYVFSGGQLYKTLGDKNNTYYRIVDHLLSNHAELLFLYAGRGDSTEMNKIIGKYPGRAFLIDEREDFIYLIENCVLYLNTYPMFGGLMMRYAAALGKIPITLKHAHDSDGQLIDQGSREIEYETYEDLIVDVDKLLLDSDYLATRQSLLKGSVITEEIFLKNLQMAIEKHTTDSQHSFVHVDTTDFRREFYRRFSLEEARNELCSKINVSLIPSYPWLLRGYIHRGVKQLLAKSTSESKKVF